MIPSEKLKQYGRPNMVVKGIIIHNTNTNLSAKECEKLMLDGMTSQGTHFFIDHKEIRQTMPLDWSVYSTGRGLDFGNLHCICIEACADADDQLDRLVVALLKAYDLSLSDIYFHNDFQRNINCPAQILFRYGNKKNYINHLRRYQNG